MAHKLASALSSGGELCQQFKASTRRAPSQKQVQQVRRTRRFLTYGRSSSLSGAIRVSRTLTRLIATVPQTTRSTSRGSRWMPVQMAEPRSHLAQSVGVAFMCEGHEVDNSACLQRSCDLCLEWLLSEFINSQRGLIWRGCFVWCWVWFSIALEFSQMLLIVS